MTTPMIQRMAEAMAQSEGLDFSFLYALHQRHWLKLARAALEAMRRPDNAHPEGVIDWVDAWWNDEIDSHLAVTALHETKDAVGREGE